MRIIIIGLGSMGRRRIRLIKQVYPEFVIAGVDLSESRCQQAQEELGVDTFLSIEDSIKAFKPEVAFVCSSPISHEKIVLSCIKYGLHVFTEINLLNNWYTQALEEANKKNVKLFISSTFLYRKEIQYIKEAVGENKVNYTYHSGQYLPDWHPWESYKDFFVSNKLTNGCREIFAIELPWLVKVFGNVTSFHVQKSNLSKLDVDFYDNYLVSLEHENGNKGLFAVDIVSRKARRKLQVYSEDLDLARGGTPDNLIRFNIETKKDETISLYNDVIQNKVYASNIIENAYTEEIINFFDYILEKALPKHSFEEDSVILDLISAIEEE